MGWWASGTDGPFPAEGELELIWGDGPADIIDGAFREIAREFVDNVGRKPTVAELRNGLEFSLGALEDDPDSLEPGYSGPLNERFQYFCKFDAADEGKARAFAEALAKPCIYDFQVRNSADDPWNVIVTGPWPDRQDGVAYVKPLARKYGGKYDGPPQAMW
jgi:hypothetical protein